MREPVNVLVPDRWYVDSETGNRFKLLRVVDDSTLDVVDEHGESRRINRWLWERDMRPVGREPVKRQPVPFIGPYETGDAETEHPAETTVVTARPLRTVKVERVDAPVLRQPVTARDQIDPIITCGKCGAEVRERSSALVKGKRLCTTCM